MSIPIFKQGNVLIAALQSAATDADLLQLKDELSQRVGRDRSKGVVLDLTVLDVMDSFATRTLRELAQTTKLRGAGMVVVGLQPEVAFAMVQLGVTLDGIATALDLEAGLELLSAQIGEGSARVI